MPVAVPSPSPPPDLVPSSASVMPECLDFFENITAPASNSTASTAAAPHPSDQSSSCNAAMEIEGVGLELSLGLSIGGGTVKISKPKAERVFPRSHPADASGSTESQREVAKAAQALLAIQNPQFLQRKSDELSQLSRDQVWQALQKSNDAFAHGVACADGSRPYQAHMDATASSLWSRRSASMQPNLPVKDSSDLGAIPIRRSSSNGVPVSMIRHQHSDVVSSPLSRQVSSIESLVERSPDVAAMSSQQRQDLLELQQKRELQAHRRLEARKRRKFLIEEKQQKKWRQNNGVQHPGKQWVPTAEKCSSAVENNLKDHGLVNERAEVKPKLSDGRKNLKRAAGESKSGSDEDVSVKVEITQEAEHVAGESVLPDEHTMMMSQEKVDCENGSYHERSQGINEGTVKAEGRKTSHSNSSETVSMETKEDHLSAQIDCGEREASSQKSGTENSSGGGSSQKSGSENSIGGVGGGGSQPVSSLSVASSPLTYPATFSVAPVPGATSPSTNMQTIFTLPSNGQHPIQGRGGSCDMQNSMASLCTPLTFPPRSNSGLKYPREGYQWLGAPGAQSMGGGSLMDRKISKENFEGKSARDGANSTLSRKEEKAVGEVAPPSMETVTPEKSTIRTSIPIARQQSWSVGDGLVQQQGLSRPKQGLSRTDAEQRTRGVDLRRGLSWDMGSLKFGRGFGKLEECSTGSQQGSYSSGHESSDQLILAEKQKQLRGSYPDLPWVSTTGSGPNGKTISGVMYISDGKRVRLVCSCHGKHMSPTEFVQHSGSDNLSNPERSIVVNAFPFLNQVATTPM